MKYFPKTRTRVWLTLGLISAGTFALNGELTRWAENVDVASRLEAVFFRTVLLPSGSVPVRRPPKETRQALSKLIASAPSDAELYSLRALEAEQQLDFAAAEADWKKYIDVASDKGEARLALADYYRRRLQPREEFEALALAAREPAPASEKLLPESQQRPWKTYQRLMTLKDEQRLDPALGVSQYWAWIQRFPAASNLYSDFFSYALAHRRLDLGDDIIAAYQKAFPKDEEFPLEARAGLAAKNGPAGQAREVYERSFRPLWPERLVSRYFALMRQTNSLRAYLERARADVAAKPRDLVSAARLFYYWQQQNNTAAAERALAEFRQRKEAQRSPWTSEELLTLARLFETLHNYDEAARNYYALYALAGSDDATAETALGSLARLLFSAPEQPIHFGAGNLTLYRDVASMDPHPGFLNGVLSLLLNGTNPPNRYAIEEQSAGAYFRREKAAELVALFESRFPNSAERAGLRERVIEAYAVYGSNDGVIRAGARFLADFPNAPNRTSVAIRMADAYARMNQTQPEFATYDALLVELAGRSGGVPLGALAQTQPRPRQPRGRNSSGPPAAESFRSPDYARVLDRYVARLVSMKRIPDALALYRREIDRNPNDPGLYDVLAAFLEQNRLDAEIEQVYQRAIAQFQDHTWEHKLARWYLRRQRQADVARLTREVVRIFSGTELDAYFREIVGQAAPVGPALYLQLNLFAHQRFPHHLSFVRNLLTAYSIQPTRDDSAYEAILRQHWYDAEDLRMRFFERLSRTGRLDAELSVVRTSNPAASGGRWQEAMDQSPAAVRMLAEGEAWRGHFETAAPMFLAIETSFPADGVVGRRTAAVYRSLGTIDPKLTDTAIAVEEKLSQADPRNRATLTRLGEIEAERERFDRAGSYWNRIPEIEPSKPDGYLEAATVYWDYYRYEDALRSIERARKLLETPSLFAYEAGAIRENERDYSHAILEYAKGALAQPGSNAEERLLSLSRRQALRASIEQLTDNLVSSRNPEMGAFNLRVALLRNQNRRDDLEKFLLDVAARTNVPELLAAIDDAGRFDGYPEVQRTAIERQIAISNDPVERMRLRLALARFHEGQGQQAQGAQVIDALYRDHPAILGVVRATIDYHWRNKNTKRAVDVLEEAAGRAEPGYQKQFLTEAARKAAEAGDYARARGFAKLLAADPYRAEYVSLMADTYARQGNDRGLRAFYEGKIRALGAAQIEQIAAMRRALIPVLTRMKDFSSGVDQYIEILNRYPEDELLPREAALYASSNGVARKLRDYYAKATADSPKDFRWPMVMARIETQLEDYPSAIASYTRAAGVRPDRADLLMARLDLEERLLRFDEAAASAAKIYELTYRNPLWMEKRAKIRARQGRTAEAVAALSQAWIEGRPDNARNFFHVAEKLEAWGMLADARKFAEEGRKRDRAEGLSVYTRILMRQHEYQTALANLAALEPEIASPIIREIGFVVERYYAPEEKIAFGAALANQPRRIDVAESAGLAELETTWRYQRLIARPVAAEAQRERQRLIFLGRERLRFDELGAQLEAYDRALPPNADHGGNLEEAAQCYRASGNVAAELRALRLAHDRSALSGSLFDRYCQMLVAQPQLLVAAIAREQRSNAANGMVNYALQHAGAAVAQQSIAARGQRLGPLWTRAYTGLAGLYYTSAAAPARAAFTGILGDMTIGTRIGKPVDREQQLAGDLWFYYGGRFGEYLGATKQAGADDYLPAMVEATPGRSEAYFTLAEYFHDTGNAAVAAADYRGALELNPARADVHDRLAVAAAAAGRADEAVEEWKLALAAFTRMMDRPRVSPKFWIELRDTLDHIGTARALGALRDDIEKLLRLYIRRNGAFQIDALLEGALAATADPEAGVTWIGELGQSAPDPVQFLSALLDRPWIPEPQKDILYRRIVESAQAHAAQTFGERQFNARNQAWTWQLSWIEYLLARRANDRARQLLESLPAEAKKQRAAEVVPLEVRVAARTGGLAALLARYQESPMLEQLRLAATQLREQGDPGSARRVLEFVYAYELKSGNLDASSFLGLAGVRLEEKDTAGALALLRRMALVSGQAFTGLEAAASLLERTSHATEAAEFLSALVKAEPWNADARRRLAEIQGSKEALAAVARSADAPYDSRVAAALALRKLKSEALTGVDAELALLSAQTPLTDREVSKPYFVRSRLEAAAITRDPAAREELLAGAIAVDPKPRAPRLAAFSAALEARHYALAVAIAHQLLPQYFREDGGFTPWIAESFLSGMDKANRVMLARGLGEAEQRLGDLRAASLYYQIAQKIEPADSVGRSLNAVRVQLALNAKNEARRPIVTDALEQDHLVRPKVSAP